MANWARIDDSNIVIDVQVTNNSDGDEGYQWLIDTFGGTWIQTSYNGRIRYNFAGLGFTYDSVNDAFYAPQPYPSWTLDSVFIWQPPTPYPSDGQIYIWDEATLSWVRVS